MTPQLISIGVLLLIFVIGMLRPVNLGVLALVAAFAMGYLVLDTPVADVPDVVLAGFPANVFVLLLGVTFLFGIASVNGMIDWLVHMAARAFREDRAAMPWVLIPLSVPFLTTGQVGVTGMVIALAISATVVDATPFSSVGALTVASAPDAAREQFSTDLMRWGFSMVVLAPVATWLLFVLPLS